MDDNKRDLTVGDLVFIQPNQLYCLQGLHSQNVSEHNELAMVISLAIRQGVITLIGSRHDELRGVASGVAKIAHANSFI